MTKFRSVWTLAALATLFVLFGVVGGADNPIDRAIVGGLALIRADHPLLTRIGVTLAFVGSAYVTIGAGIAAAALLIVLRRTTAGLLLVAGVLLERLAVDGIKLLVARQRPSFDEHPVLTHSFSYPSGHSANTMSVFVMIALLLAPARHRVAAVVAAISLAIPIGLSRPLLGVHWASDVLGGWTLAAIALWVFVRVGERSGALTFEQQHQIVGGHGAAMEKHQPAR